MKRLKPFISALLIFSVLILSTAIVAAQSTEIQQGINETNGGNQVSNPANTLNTSISNVVDVISAIVGIVAVIMLIVAALRFVSSAGNPEAVKSAKNTALYAIVGLVIVALAQVIVHFVLHKVT